MQTTSYRVLKWTLFAGFAASMATACVVTSSDGGDDIFDGGESGSSNNDAGKTSTEGGTNAGTGGKTSTGGGGSSTTAGTAGAAAGTAGTTAAGGDAGYVPGLCQADDPTPSMVPSCDPDAKDAKDACRKCMRASCCDEWQTCYGDAPKTACGWGPTETSNSQFECIRECFDKGAATATDPDMLLADCGAGCAVQCDAADNGLIMDSTSALVDCANTSCGDDCFPF